MEHIYSRRLAITGAGIWISQRNGTTSTWIVLKTNAVMRIPLKHKLVVLDVYIYIITNIYYIYDA